MLQTLTKTKSLSNWSDNAETLSVHAGLDSANWKLGLIKSLDNPAFQTTIENLARQSLASNPFFELPVLKASCKNLGNQNIQYLFLSQEIGKDETLKLFAPVVLAPIGIFRHKVLKTWTTPYTPLGVPLVYDDNSQQTLKAFMECLQISEHPKAKAIVFEQIAKDNAFIKNLYHSSQLSEKLLLSASTPRAGLKPISNHDYVGTHFSGKRKQRLRVARNELEKLGEVTFVSNSDQSLIKEQLEAFLLLEQQGWKGTQKTALKNNTSSEQFAINAVLNATDENKCRIHSLMLNKQTIASLISFQTHGYVYPWKIAYDEAYAKHSVGNLLAVHATSEFVKSDSFKGLDSLASEYNETTLRFWPDEKEFFTMTIGIGKSATQTTLAITEELNRLKRIKKTLRKIIKKSDYLGGLVSSLRR